MHDNLHLIYALCFFAYWLVALYKAAKLII